MFLDESVCNSIITQSVENKKTRLLNVFKSGAGGSIYPAIFQFVIMVGHLVKNVIIYMIYTILNHNEKSLSVAMQI